MALTQAMCTSFKQELLVATHNFTLTTGDVFKIALVRATAAIVGTYGAASTAYSNITANSDEASGTGYTAGGNTLTNVTPTTSGTTALTDFNDSTWTTATLTASGAMIYNSSKSNKAVGLLSFGGDKTSTAGDFSIIFPVADATNAIIRIA